MSDDFVTVNFVCVFANVAFFIVIQTLFFVFLASKQVDNVVTYNTKILSHLRAELCRAPHQSFFVNVLDTMVLDAGTSDIKQQQIDKQRASEHNVRQLLLFCGSYLLLVVCIIAGLLWWNWKKKRPFTFAHWIGLIMIVLAYATEMMLIFFVIQPWRYVGQFELLGMITGARCGAVQRR